MKKIIYKLNSVFALFNIAITLLTAIIPNTALALPSDSPKTISGLATKVQTEIQGSGLIIAMNAVGLAAVGFALFNGFNKGFLITAGLILLFANIFFPMVNEYYSTPQTQGATGKTGKTG